MQDVLLRRSCYRCRIIDKKLAEQKMAPLPDCRLLPAPAFNVTSLDLFGPLTVRDTVKKRTHMKVWGTIFTCAVTRAVYIDVTEGYSTGDILLTLRRFILTRIKPSEFISDQGSQLIKASKEVASLTKDWNWTTIAEWASNSNIHWKFVPAEGQHMNGLSESLIRSVKRSIQHVIGNNILSCQELQTAFFEIANILNSRPIGIKSSDPEYPQALTPNDLLIGASNNETPLGPFNDKVSNKMRVRMIEDIVDKWWSRWYDSVLPTLVPSYKWLQRHRSCKINDICLIRYKSLRSTYRLGRIKDIHRGTDGLVRRVTLEYKLPNEKKFRRVDRAIHGIAVIVPVEEQ